jgi:hypothetical protein
MLNQASVGKTNDNPYISLLSLFGSRAENFVFFSLGCLWQTIWASTSGFAQT